jgi:long-chain acyl-CoA synthetase
MIVNAYGKNVYPTPVENIYLKSRRIEQLFLIGDKREYLTAIVIPNRESMQEEFRLQDSFFEEPETFVTDQEIIEWINQDIKNFSKELAKYERIKNFRVKRTPFSIEEGEITPTMKIKRKVVEQKYAESINEMYTASVEAD